MITIDDNYGIQVDEYNYMLCRLRTKQSGKNAGEKYSTPMKYFRSLSEALEGYYKESVRASLYNADITLPDALIRLNEAHDQAVAAIRLAVPEIKVIERWVGEI